MDIDDYNKLSFRCKLDLFSSKELRWVLLNMCGVSTKGLTIGGVKDLIEQKAQDPVTRINILNYLEGV